MVFLRSLRTEDTLKVFWKRGHYIGILRRKIKWSSNGRKPSKHLEGQKTP